MVEFPVEAVQDDAEPLGGEPAVTVRRVDGALNDIGFHPAQPLDQAILGIYRHASHD